MTAAMPAPRARPNLGVLLGVLGAAFAVLIAGAVVTERGDAPSTPKVSPRDLHAVLAYADAVAPATYAAGFAVIKGIRPDIADFRAGAVSAEVWRADMDARAADFARARAAFAAAKPPAALAAAARAFDRAFARYAQAVRTLASAGDATGAERDRLIAEGAALGDAGDAAFDRGAAAIQRARRAAGMGPDARFPDKGGR